MNLSLVVALRISLLSLLLSAAQLHAQPLLHTPSGITLPEEIAGFTRTQYQDYESKQPGLGAGYNYNNGRGAVATVYIYTAGHSAIASGADAPVIVRMREQTLREIVEFAKSRNEITEHQSQRRLLIAADPADIPVLFDALVITGPAGARDTMAWLWGARGHFIKIRMTRLPKGKLPQQQIETFYEFVVRSTAD